jgi:hypothetical protein
MQSGRNYLQNSIINSFFVSAMAGCGDTLKGARWRDDKHRKEKLKG